MRCYKVSVKCGNRWHTVTYDGKRLSFPDHAGKYTALRREALLSEFGGARKCGCAQLLRAWRTGDRENLSDPFRSVRAGNGINDPGTSPAVSRIVRRRLEALTPAARARILASAERAAGHTVGRRAELVSDVVAAVLTEFGIPHVVAMAVTFDVPLIHVNLPGRQDTAECTVGESPPPHKPGDTESVLTLNPPGLCVRVSGAEGDAVNLTAAALETALVLVARWTAADIENSQLREARENRNRAYDKITANRRGVLERYGSLAFDSELNCLAFKPESGQHAIYGADDINAAADAYREASRVVDELARKGKHRAAWLKRKLEKEGGK